MLNASEPDPTPQAPPPVAAHPGTRASTTGARTPSRFGRVRLSTAACFGVSVLIYVIAVVLEGLGVPWPIVGTLLLAAAVVFLFSTLIALYRALHGAVVDWCLDEGGIAVGEALLGAIRTLPRRMQSERPEAASAGGWERWGLHGHRLEAEEYAAARAHIIDRVNARVARLAS